MITEKYIYRIVNMINGKSYIGQSVHPKKRFSEHTRKNSDSNPKFKNAIAKYGKENFKLEILYYGKDYNEQEKFYIALFDSVHNGYNIAEGGEEPPIFKREEHPNAKLTEAEVQTIKQLLIKKTPNKEIYNLFPHISPSEIHRINYGMLWKDTDLSYPLCVYSTTLDLSTIELIIMDLKNTKMTFKEIGEKYNIAKTTIVGINNGKTNGAKLLEKNFPIRKLQGNYSLITDKEKIKEIQQLLISSDKSNKQIANEYKISMDVLQNIIAGRTYKDNLLSYPLRQKKNGRYQINKNKTT